MTADSFTPITAVLVLVTLLAAVPAFAQASDPFQAAPAPKPAPHRQAPQPQDELPPPEPVVAMPPPATSVAPAAPPTGGATPAPTVTPDLQGKEVASGVATRISRAIYFNHKDCAGPEPTITIVEQPAHGTISITDEAGTIPAHVKVGSPGKCRGRPIVGRVVYYRSVPGYHGPDHVRYNEVSPTGNIIDRNIVIAVQ